MLNITVENETNLSFHETYSSFWNYFSLKSLAISLKVTSSER